MPSTLSGGADSLRSWPLSRSVSAQATFTWPVSWLAYGVFQSTLVAGLPDDKLSPAWGPPPPALLEARRLHREAGTAAKLEEMGAIH